ncbi:MFS transporter [Carnobacterium divergens]|uniref:MFS transporter n=1 Tax=Carnobacterium divergens TaxID=2748 RepID=UPI0039C9790D
MTTDKIKVSTLIAIVASAMLTFMGIVSETALNVAFPILTKEFNVTSATIQWLTTGYLLVVAILVPISPMLVKRYPTKRLFQAAVVIFTVGTIICGFSVSFPMLLLGRLIQAIGTGISLPLMFNLILALIPMHKRGVIMGIAGLVTSFAPAIGPTYGDVVTSIGWQSIFLILLPFLVIALVAGSLTIQSISTIEKQKIDFLSIGLSIVASGIIYGFSLAGETGWLHLGVVGSLGIGAIGLALFSIRQLKIDVPLINLAVFKFPMFTLGLIQVFF